MAGKKSALDDGKGDGGDMSMLPVGVIFAVLVGAMALKSNLWTDIKYAVLDVLRHNSENEEINIFNHQDDAMFCPAPGYNNMVFGQDPLREFMLEGAIYSMFWMPSAEPKTLPFEFEKNAKSTNDNAGFFDSIPQHVIDDETVLFILSGHATNYYKDIQDLPPEKRENLTDDFNKIKDRYEDINKRTVDRRLEHIRERLTSLGISPDRIKMHNFVDRYNRREVDVEVCFNGVPEA
ncbi:MAG: hypothetical protein ACRBDI_03405 [Alphaproteobacteria bacterium]